MEVKIPQSEFVVENFIGGSYVSGDSAEEQVFTPYSGKMIGKFKSSSPSQVNKAVEQSSEAQKAWAATPIKERCSILLKFRELLIKDIDRISNIAAVECGKTFAEAKAGVLKGIEVTDFAIGLQNSDLGGAIEVSRGVQCQYRREPIGVVCGIVPFNFPAMVPMWMFPIAIACGNAFILKPSEKVPITMNLVAELFNDAGLPAGIFSIVNGTVETSKALIEHKSIAAVAFVGSTPIARKVYVDASSHSKRCLALGGAKNHVILAPDADPEITIGGIVDSFTGCAGQRCMAASLLLAVGDTDALIQKVVERASKMELGKDMGAIIDQASLTRMRDIIDRAEKSGCKILLDGRNPSVPEPYQGGTWLAPTIIQANSVDDECAQTEIFGPVLTIVNVSSIQEAMEIENKNPFGNATSIFTTSGGAADYVARRASNGMIGINIGVPVPREPFSFGGTKESCFGYGDITGESAVDFWSNRKKITSKWSLQKDNNWMS